MEFFMGFVLTGAVVAAVLWLWARRRRRDRALAPEYADFDPNDLAELSASMSSIAADHRRGESNSTTAALRTRLQPVITRRSPVRRISPAPVEGATRICFADGTGVLVRSQHGRLALLAQEASRYPVCLRSCRIGPDGPELTFECYGGQVTALVVGLDQAD